MEKITMDREYQTRNGCAVRLLATDCGEKYPVVGLIAGNDYPSAWTSCGHFYHHGGESIADLIPKPVTHAFRRWFNFWPDGSGVSYTTREDADRYGPGRIACKEVEFTYVEGEGLESAVAAAKGGEA